MFQFYDNFAGGTLKSSLWTSLSATYTISNQLKVNSPGGGLGNSFLESIPTFNTNIVVDMYRDATVANWFGFDIPATYANGGVLFYDQGGWSTFNNAAQWIGGSESTNTWYIESGAVTSSYQAILYVNYASTVSTPTSYFGNSNGNLYLGATGGTGYIDWVRVRTYPPSGTMPTTSFGAII